MKTRILFFFAASFIYSSIFSQTITSKTYKITLNWKTKESGSNYLCVGVPNGLRVKDTCAVDTVDGTCTFNLDVDLTPKGLYTIVKKSKSNDRRQDVYIDLVIDQDSVIVFDINQLNKFEVVTSDDNKILMNFINENSSIYEKLYELQSEKANSEKANLDSAEYEKYKNTVKLYEKKLATVKQQYQKRYPKHIINTIVSIEDVNQKLHNSAPDRLEYNKQYFKENMPWNDYRLTCIPNFYDALQYLIDNYLKTNVDSVASYLLHIGSKIIKPNYSEYVNVISEIFCAGKPPFQRADEVCVVINDSLVKSKPRLFEEKFIDFINRKCKSFKFSKIGNNAPDFEFLDTSGNKISLRDINSYDYIVLAFWDPHCVHCRKQIPILDSVVKNLSLKNMSVKVVGIKTDGPKNDWVQFINDHKLVNNWIHCEDTKELRESRNNANQLDFRITYGIDQTPLFFLLDRNKKILAKYFSTKELVNYIK